MSPGWKPEVGRRFSAGERGAKWDRMYADSTVRLDEHVFRRRRDFVVDLVLDRVPADGRVLDLGCGAGPIVTELRARGRSCLGMDYSLDMLRFARERLRERGVEDGGLFRGDAEALPCPDRAFDCVLCVGVISYLEDYRGVLREIHRVLRAGATAVVTFRNVFNPVLSDPVRLLATGARRVLRGEGPRDEGVGRFLDPRAVRGELEAAGLACERQVGIGFGPFSVAGRRVLPERWAIRASDVLTSLVRTTRMDWALDWMGDVAILICRKR